MSMDILVEKIIKKSNPTVVGLDPKLESMPPVLIKRAVNTYGNTLEAAASAIYEFNCTLIDALCDIVPAVKPQSAYYEMYGVEGVAALKKTIDYAKKKGMYVIADCKRNDIGSTAEAYSAAYLGKTSIAGIEIEPFGADSLTVNGYLGIDGIEPFLKPCRDADKSIFVLVKTSNPSSSDLQDLVCGTRTVYRAMADLVYKWGQDTVGKHGFSNVGFVVGATHPTQLTELRRAYPESFFLVPGYGAQGGSGKDLAGAFDRRGLGAIVNSSRGIIYAWKKTGDKEGTNYAEAARDAALEMRKDLQIYC